QSMTHVKRRCGTIGPMHETAERLARAALALFDEHGYDAVTTADIAEAAGVSQRTFFRHFAAKHDALFADTDASTADFLEGLYAQPPELGVTEALITAIAEHAERWPLRDDDLDRVRVARATPSLHDAVAAYQARFEAQIGRWIGQRLRRDETDFDVRVLAATLVAARRVVVDEWFASGGRVDLVVLARRAIGAVDATALGRAPSQRVAIS
ncbi:MAG: helix-turn-helix domain-containing protein, partial [Actinomycetota bacterium]